MTHHAQLTFKCPYCEASSCYDLPEGVASRPADRRHPTDKSKDYKAILAGVAERHGMTVAAMISRKRQGRFVNARCEAALSLREHTGLSLAEIGFMLGGRDHTTVIHMLERGVVDHLDGDHG